MIHADCLALIGRETVIDLDGAAAVKRFHDGDREFLGLLYRQTYEALDKAVGRVLRGADRETVVHDVYLRLLTKPELRRSFTGGSMRSWLMTIAYNLAVDFWRHHGRETSLDDPETCLIDPMSRRMEERAELNLFVERFRRDGLPEELWPLFEARFVERLDQREAARRLDMRRTTLAYRELRVRKLLRAFLRRRSP